MHLPEPGFTPGTGELHIFIPFPPAVGLLCLDIFPIASCQWSVLCGCVSTGSYVQTAHFTLIYEQNYEHSNFWPLLTWAGISLHVVAVLVLGPAVTAHEADAAEMWSRGNPHLRALL